MINLAKVILSFEDEKINGSSYMPLYSWSPEAMNRIYAESSAICRRLKSLKPELLMQTSNCCLLWKHFFELGTVPIVKHAATHELLLALLNQMMKSREAPSPTTVGVDLEKIPFSLRLYKVDEENLKKEFEAFKLRLEAALARLTT